MYGTDASGKKWGKLYEFSATGITASNWTEQDGVMTITDKKANREPDIIVDIDSSNDISLKQLEIEFNDMIESVTIYGGFYIGRYETGNLSQSEAVVVKNNNDISNQTWYTQYILNKTVRANNNVTSTMIWGSQWDAVMRWMYNSKDEVKKTYTYDSTGKGYYGENGKEPILTGSDDNYAINNIYDMAGNVREDTIEVSTLNSSQRITRGGFYNWSGSRDPASSRGSSYMTSKSLTDGSRISLYISI